MRITGLNHLRAALGRTKESDAHCDWKAIGKTIAKHIVSTSIIHYKSGGSNVLQGERFYQSHSCNNFREGVKHKH